MDTITKPDASGNVLLLKLLRAETLEGLVLGEPTLTLHAARMGGNNITKKNLFYTSIQFAGGAVVRYQLKAPDGIKVLKAGTESAYQQQSESDHLESNP